MIQMRRILCPCDFSDFSRRALDHAAALAKWYESTVTLFHVCAVAPTAVYAPASPILPSMILTGEDRDEVLASMKRFAATEVDASIPIEFEITEGTAAAEILARARAMPSDLIVMGTHGRSGFERLLLGSVAEKVLRKAACPVLLVPRRVADVVPAPPVLFKRIVCGIDFSECSMHALNHAISLAQEADAHLTVLHVLELPTELPPGQPEPVLKRPAKIRALIASIEEDRRLLLQQAVPESVRQYCTVETVLATGTPYREILRVAAEQKSDLVVIGVHGRGAADLFFFGSTTQHVVRQAACPVLTLRT